MEAPLGSLSPVDVMSEEITKLLESGPQDWSDEDRPVVFRPLPKLATSPPSFEEKVRGSLLGLAWGDVLGCPVEGYRAHNIIKLYGNYSGLPTLYSPSKLKEVFNVRGLKRIRPIGLHSDDTQQALALLSVISSSPQPLDVNAIRNSWGRSLVAGHLAAAWRGTGRHFNAAVHRLRKDVDATRAGDDSAGMGASMRIGPLGALLRNHSEELLADIVFNVSLVTHRTLEAPAGAFAVAWCVRQFIAGATAATIRAKLESAVHAAEQRFLDSEKRDMKFPDLPKRSSFAAMIGSIIRRADAFRSTKPTCEALWEHLRELIRDHSKEFIASGGSPDDACGGGGEGGDDGDDDVEETGEKSSHKADESKEEEEEKNKEPKPTTPVAAKGKKPAAAKLKKKKSSAPRLHAFNPNQGHVTLGATHAIIFATLDDDEIGDPNALLLSIISVGYDTDTVAAIAGTILGARYGLSWIPVSELRDRDALERWATMLVNVRSSPPEPLNVLLRRESMWSALEMRWKQKLISVHGEPKKQQDP